jgi:hypothetical protein
MRLLLALGQVVEQGLQGQLLQFVVVAVVGDQALLHVV